MNVNKKKSVRTTEATTITIDNNDIIQYLKSKGHAVNKMSSLKIYVQVPSGGDFSGKELDIDSDTPLRIEYKIETTTEVE